MRETPDERFWSKVQKEPGPCWLWRGATTNGYGYFGSGKTSAGERHSRRAHRYSYELMVGPIPLDLELDHVCRVRACVNPAHLEPVTRRENYLRSPLTRFNGTHRSSPTHCSRGHVFDAANTIVRMRPNAWGEPRPRRSCRVCDIERKRLARARTRGENA